MGRVDCFNLSGYYVWFNSNDHLPPHFHVEKTQEWELKVHFLREADEMFELAWGQHGPTGREKKAIAAKAKQYRAQLLEEWGTKAVVKTPGAEKEPCLKP